MKNKNELFLKILDLELRDLEKDLLLLVERYKNEHDHQVISNYVFLENCALLQNEIFGVEGIEAHIKTLDPDNFADIDALLEQLKNMVAERWQKRANPQALGAMVNRKFEKVYRYVQNIDDE